MVLDQPCCQFEPHIICLREGQTLVVKNSGTIPHNTKIDSPGDNPSVNPLIAGGRVGGRPRLEGRDDALDDRLQHPRLDDRLHQVFNHPYFAVTDEDGKFKIEKAPAGKYHIVAWQESVGYLSKTYKKGDPIEIKPDDVTEVKFEVKPKPAG